jgi:peroxiredoxin
VIVDKKSLARGAGFLLLVFVAAFGGVFAGMKFRQSQAPPAPAVPESKIQAGMEFPGEQVEEPQGAPHSTTELVSDGAVVMFLKLDCQPCGNMVARWQELVASGELDGVPTLGITMDEAERIPAYQEQKGLKFPIYRDPTRRFVEEWAVSAVPLVVVVGPGGEVVDTFASPQQIDPSKIRQQVGLG